MANSCPKSASKPKQRPRRPKLKLKPGEQPQRICEEQPRLLWRCERIFQTLKVQRQAFQKQHGPLTPCSEKMGWCLIVDFRERLVQSTHTHIPFNHSNTWVSRVKARMSTAVRAVHFCGKRGELNRLPSAKAVHLTVVDFWFDLFWFDKCFSLFMRQLTAQVTRVLSLKWLCFQQVKGSNQSDSYSSWKSFSGWSGCGVFG